MKYWLKITRYCDIRYLQVSKDTFYKVEEITFGNGKGEKFKCVNYDDLDKKLQKRCSELFPYF